MTAEIIDGKKIALEIQTELKQRISLLQAKGISPKLITILVGEDPASLSYLRGITRTCGETGVATDCARLPAMAVQQELMGKIAELNRIEYRSERIAQSTRNEINQNRFSD